MPDAERTKGNASPALTFIQLVQRMLCTACWESQKESIFHPRLSNGKCKEGTMPDIIRIRTVRVPERKKKKKKERGLGNPVRVGSLYEAPNSVLITTKSEG